MANGLGRNRWRLGIVGVVVVCALALIAPVMMGAISDSIADRELGQSDFTHNVSPSFVRAKSLDLQGNPRGQGVAIDTKASPNHLFVSDQNSNRVLGWSDTTMLTNGKNADIVIGAPDFFTHQAGCTRDDTGFCGPLRLSAVRPGRSVTQFICWRRSR